jgi:hypothetical protein
MSGTLLARKRPKSDRWPWTFKNPLRDKLRNKFDGHITSSAISYLEGLRDCSDNGDSATLQKMIDALSDGDEIEFKVEY